jgi:endonuclease/exonuclease/phosphatase family metal-dependent hydrolase
MIRRLFTLGVGALALTTSCSETRDDADAGRDAGSDAETEPFRLRAMTYNAALAPDFEPFAVERAPLVVDALSAKARDLELLCVQEFWLGSDAEALASAARAELPHALRAPPEPGSGACTVDELTSVGGCLEGQCSELEGVERTACAQSACAAEIAALGGGCLGCILNSLGEPLESCAGDGSEPEDPAIFGGAHDGMLLSRYPLEGTEVTRLDGYLVRTAVLYGRVEIPGLGPVHAFCTHLGSPLGVIPYAGPHGSWDGEHGVQVEALATLVADRASDGLPVVVLGDLNMGPAVGTSVAVHPGQYVGLLALASLGNPYVSRGDALCTDCADNSFHALAPDYDDSLIDHVLIRNFPAAEWSMARVLAEPVELGEVPFHLSDHYGVSLTLSRDP